jgi:hypothetical protein
MLMHVLCEMYVCESAYCSASAFSHLTLSFYMHNIVLLFTCSGSSNLINDVWLYSIADGSWRKVRLTLDRKSAV